MTHVISNLVLLPAQVTRRMPNSKEDQKVQSCHTSGREQKYVPSALAINSKHMSKGPSD